MINVKRDYGPSDQNDHFPMAVRGHWKYVSILWLALLDLEFAFRCFPDQVVDERTTRHQHEPRIGGSQVRLVKHRMADAVCITGVPIECA